MLKGIQNVQNLFLLAQRAVKSRGSESCEFEKWLLEELLSERFIRFYLNYQG